nr:TolC family protein [Bacteroidia bacterium]
MKLNFKNSILVITTLLLTNNVWAQTKSLTLKDLLKIGLDQSYDIQVSKLEEALVEKQITETRGLTLPQINGNGSVNNNYKRQVLVLPAGLGGGTSEGPNKIEAGTAYSSVVGVEATQALIDVAALEGLKAAKAGRDYARVNTQQTKEQVVSTIAQQYYQILTSMEEAKLQQHTIEIMQQLVQASEGKYENGLLRKVDVDRIKVNLINAQSRLTQAQNDVALKTNQLKVTLGLPYATQLVLDTLDVSNIV